MKSISWQCQTKGTFSIQNGCVLLASWEDNMTIIFSHFVSNPSMYSHSMITSYCLYPSSSCITFFVVSPTHHGTNFTVSCIVSLSQKMENNPIIVSFLYFVWILLIASCWNGNLTTKQWIKLIRINPKSILCCASWLIIGFN